MKAKSKRTAIAALVLALMWMFLLPVQVFAEDGVGEPPEGDLPAIVSDEGGSAEVPAPDAPDAEASAPDAPDAEAPAPEGGDIESIEAEDDDIESIEAEDDDIESIEAEDDDTEGSEAEDGDTEGSEVEDGDTEGTEAEDGKTEGTEAEKNAEEENASSTPGAAFLAPSLEETAGEGGSEGEAGDTADSGEWKYYGNSTDVNAIQQAVDAAIAAGQKYITVVVQDGTYTGGLVIDNSGVDENGNAKESIIVNIIAHDAYEHAEEESGTETQAEESGSTETAAPAPDAVYPVPANSDGTVDTSAINADSAGGVKLEGGVSVKNVELLLAGIYLTLQEQKANQGKIESMFTEEGNIDVKVENAENFTYYGTTEGDSANITLTDVENAAIDTGNGDDVLDITTSTSPNVELDLKNKDDAALKAEFENAQSADSTVHISTGGGNDKVTVTEHSSVTRSDNVVSVRKGKNRLAIEAGDGADTITLKGSSGLLDLKKDVSEEIANKVFAIISANISGHGSIAVIEGGAASKRSIDSRKSLLDYYYTHVLKFVKSPHKS